MLAMNICDDIDSAIGSLLHFYAKLYQKYVKKNHTWNNPTRALFFATFPPWAYTLFPKVPTGVPPQLPSDEERDDESVSLGKTSCCPETFFKAANHCFLECSSGANKVCACPSDGLRKLTRKPFFPGCEEFPENADLNEPPWPPGCRTELFKLAPEEFKESLNEPDMFTLGFKSSITNWDVGIGVR